MLNLVNQNKKHAKRHIAILQVMTIEEATFLLHIQRLHNITWTFLDTSILLLKYTRKLLALSLICWQKLGITTSQLPSRWRKWPKMA